MAEKSNERAPEVSVKAKESDGRQTGSLIGGQPGSPVNAPSFNMVSTKPSCGGSMDLPLDANKAGSFFVVGSTPQLALPTQDPVAKLAKSEGGQQATSDRQIDYEAKIAGLL
jgi:hypothetical protein